MRNTWQINRRSFLRGAGVAVALPALQAMEPLAMQPLAMQPATNLLGGVGPETNPDGSARRMCYVYFPNGASMPKEHDKKWGKWRWLPHDPGKDYQLTEVLKCMAPWRDQMTLLGGLSHPLSRQLLGHLAGDTWLTAGDLRGDAYKNRISVDQIAALQLKKHTRYPSLVLSTDGGVGYKSRTATLSFDHAARPIPAEHRQRLIFERYFTAGAGKSLEQRKKSLLAGKKIVDLVLEDSKRLHQRLGKHDQEKLDQYLQSLDAIEEQLERNEQWLNRPLPPFDSSHVEFDIAADVDPGGYLRSMYDLIALALQLDLTRVVTYMTGREDGMGFADSFPNRALGIKRGHHTISHDQHEGHWQQWGRYDRWHAEQFAHFIKRLDEIKDDAADGASLLDTTEILYGSCCSTTHNARNLPLMLIGGGKLGLKHGHYRKYDEKTPFSNVFVGMLNAVGVKTERFVDSTGSMPEIFG